MARPPKIIAEELASLLKEATEAGITPGEISVAVDQTLRALTQDSKATHFDTQLHVLEEQLKKIQKMFPSDQGLPYPKPKINYYPEEDILFDDEDIFF